VINNILETEYKRITDFIGKSLSNKSILVTGANGLIGSYLVDYLSSIESKVYAMSRSVEKLRKRFGTNSKVIFIEQDLSQSFSLDTNFDYIIHAASNAHPIAYSQDPVGTMLTNFVGTLSLLKCAKESNSKFLYCYPESKRAAETLCVAYSQQYGVTVNVARLCYVYGPTITDTNSRADAQFLRNALNKEDIVMKSEGSQRRTYCYVADCVSALLKILIDGQNGEFYNIANPDSIVSVKEYAQTLANISGVKLKFEVPNDVEAKGYSTFADSILCADKLCSLGWKAIYSIREGLEHTLKIKGRYQK